MLLQLLCRLASFERASVAIRWSLRAITATLSVLAIPFLAASCAEAAIHLNGVAHQGPATTLYHPMGIAADSLGNIYVADTGNHRIIKYNSLFIPILKFGSLGTGPGRLY